MKRLLAAVLAAAGVALCNTGTASAGVEPFTVCPSGLSGVSTPDTSCEFADNVRRAFYTEPGWTVFAYSPVTGQFYTMQCFVTVTTHWWPVPKRCFGINAYGELLVVYIA